MSDLSLMPATQCEGVVVANTPVSSGLILLEVEFESPVTFQPGQFAMLNLAGDQSFVFSRPFSIYRAKGRRMSFLYRVVGRGTRALGTLTPGASLSFLGPLGRPFPEPAGDQPVILIAGGVGLPPVAAWLDRQAGRSGLEVAPFFGARDGADVPWGLLGDLWHVSVDALEKVPSGRQAWQGLVTELVASHEDLAGSKDRMVLACGPTPLLKAASRLAAERGWTCWLSMEEHMGCGYGVCKGCVVPVHDLTREPGSVRNATCCQEGPVFNAADLAWQDGQ
jgi:dihydroorotate dehydrogenase electron transfer subunit